MKHGFRQPARPHPRSRRNHSPSDASLLPCPHRKAIGLRLPLRDSSRDLRSRPARAIFSKLRSGNSTSQFSNLLDAAGWTRYFRFTAGELRAASDARWRPSSRLAVQRQVRDRRGASPERLSQATLSHRRLAPDQAACNNLPSRRMADGRDALRWRRFSNSLRVHTKMSLAIPNPRSAR